MELWVRSQNKKELIKTNRIYQYAGTIYAEAKEDIELGNYNSRERALEVLDEIQNKLNEPKNSYEDLVNKLKIFSETPIIKCDNNDNCNISLNIVTLKDMIIYEMPKE